MGGSVGQQHDTPGEHEQGTLPPGSSELSVAEAELDQFAGMRRVEVMVREPRAQCVDSRGEVSG